MGPGDVPQDSRIITLYSDPVTTTTDSNGNFTFANVQYSHHTLVLNTQAGVEFDRYILNFAQSSTTGYSLSGNTITINYTNNTLGIQLLFNSDDVTSSLNDVVFTEEYTAINPQTGKRKLNSFKLFNSILFGLIALFICTLVVYVIRKKMSSVMDMK